MKSVWKGSISFGLVSIPVQLFTAQETQALGFHVLHDVCLTRLEYKRWCPHCKKDVMWDDTVKGIKKSDGSYLVLTQDLIKQLHPQKTDQIAIVEFVDSNQVPIIYLNHHYYVTPAKPSNEAFALFVKALKGIDKVAIGRFVMRNKEYTCVIRSDEDYLVLTTLFYPYEVRGLEKITYKEKVQVSTKELKLAKDIIKKLSVKKFDITHFKDTFAQEIKKLLKQKSTKRGKKIIKELPHRKTTKKPTLEQTLRTSIAHINRPAAYAKRKP